MCFPSYEVYTYIVEKSKVLPTTDELLKKVVRWAGRKRKFSCQHTNLFLVGQRERAFEDFILKSPQSPITKNDHMI